MKYLVIDFETISPKYHAPIPIEVACCFIHEDHTVQEEPYFSSFIAPHTGKIGTFDTELTGITALDIEDARSFAEVFSELEQYCQSLGEFTAIAHNVPFDRGIVLAFAEHLPTLATCPWLDTIHVAKKKLALDSYALDPVAEALGLSINGHRHRAFPDAHLTAHAFVRLQRLPDRDPHVSDKQLPLFSL